MLSYIVLYNEEQVEELNTTLASIKGQKKAEVYDAQVIIANSTNEAVISQVTNQDGIEEVHMPGLKHGDIFIEAVASSTGDHVLFLYAGQEIGSNVMQRIEEMFKKDERIKMVCLERGKDQGEMGIEGVVDEDTILDINASPELVPVTLFSSVYDRKALKDLAFEHNGAYGEDITQIWGYLMSNPIMAYLANTDITFPRPKENSYIQFSPARNQKWYGETLESIYLKFIEELKQDNIEVPMFISYGLFYELKIRFFHNKETRDKRVYEDVVKEFFPVVRKVLQEVPDSVIFNWNDYKNYRLPEALGRFFLDLKYENQERITYKQVQKDVHICFNGQEGFTTKNQLLRINTINYSRGGLLIEATQAFECNVSDYELHVTLKGQEIPVEETETYTNISYFGHVIAKKKSYAVKIDMKDLKNRKNKVQFYSIIGGLKSEVHIVSGRFSSRISTECAHSYWVVNGYFMSRTSDECGLVFKKYSKAAHVGRELRYLPAVFGRSKKMFLYRLIYWFTKSKYKNRNIWLTFDKFYKGGDNGEYFYKYVLEHGKDVEPVYIINKDYPDAKRLKKEGLHPLYYGTWQHMMALLHSSIVATTHANIPVFSGVSTRAFDMLEDLFQGEIVCIQHGLTVQYLAHNMNQQYDNIKRYYCASKYEIQNLEDPSYGYTGKDVFRLTGVPRYDGLVNDDKRQILINPTWRSYISMPTSRGNTRPYSDEFKDTTYFKIFNSLINNEELIQASQKYGYRLIYLVHPTITNQIKDFQVQDGVEIRSPLKTNYEKIFRESSLMVTDYSGVQFDFAYMRKPIVYYHPTELPPHYEEGGFFYDTMGFGEICAQEDELVRTLISYMETDCNMSEKYRDRVGEFYAFDDHDNCKRIYEDLLEYQKMIGEENGKQ